MTKSKTHGCPRPGCGKSFTRFDHLQRHMLNHSTWSSTCSRCRRHFKRPDLLHRHMLRHQKKDEDAGGPGLGAVESRKRMWLDTDGSIIRKRPLPSQISSISQGRTRSQEQRSERHEAAMMEGYDHERRQLVDASSPSPAFLNADFFEQFTQIHPELSGDPGFTTQTLEMDMFDFLANPSWVSQPAVVPALVREVKPICSCQTPQAPSTIASLCRTLTTGHSIMNLPLKELYLCQSTASRRQKSCPTPFSRSPSRCHVR